MHLNQIISHTPIWVWILFAYLMLRGIKSLRPRKMTPERMLILPIIFLVWALYGIATELANWPVGLTTFAIALTVGIAGGWINALRLPAATFDARTGKVTRPGSATILVLVLVGFFAKYVLSVVLVLHPYLGAQEGFASLFGGVAGLVDGAFWGGVILQYRQAFHRIRTPEAPSPSRTQ